jgi:cystathionine beta-synthase
MTNLDTRSLAVPATGEALCAGSETRGSDPHPDTAVEIDRASAAEATPSSAQRAAEPELKEDVLGSVTELIGNTPLVELNVLAKGLPGRVLVKLEGRNAGGSAKDRIALQMIRTAEASGELLPGATIVESSSGNTGIGLALVGRLTGHPVIIIHSAYISDEKKALLSAYGAQLVEADWEAPPESPNNARAIADRIARELPNSWRASQYDNESNPGAHYQTTGPEIWRQTAHKVTHFVASVGTGGTISGTGRYLKDASGDAVRVIGADPVGSTYSGNSAGLINVEGAGNRWEQDFWPATYNKQVVDEFVVISDRDIYDTVHALASQEALLVGPSSGLAVAAAIEVAKTAPLGSVVVVIAPDTGANYLTKAFDADWLAEIGVGGPRPSDGDAGHNATPAVA